MEIKRRQGIAAIVIGALQLLLAVGLIIVSFVFWSYGTRKTSETPFWAGFPFLVSGGFGIAAGISKNHCCMVTFLVLNVIMTILAVIASVISTIGMAFWFTSDNRIRCQPGETVVYKGNECSYYEGIATRLIVVIVILCYISAAFALAGSILGRRVTCPASPDPPMQDAEGDAVSASNPQGRSVISGVIASEREIDCGGVKLRVEEVAEFSAVMF